MNWRVYLIHSLPLICTLCLSSVGLAVQQFTEFSPDQNAACVDCQKTVDLADKTHQAISSLIKKEKIEAPEILDAADRLGGLIIITQETINKNMQQEDCPSLADYQLVFDPVKRPEPRSLLISKEIPLAAIKSIGLTTSSGTRYFFKGMLAGEEVLVEVVTKNQGLGEIRYYRYDHAQLQEKYADLPDLGSSKNISSERDRFALPIFKEDLSLGSLGEAKGEISLKDKKASLDVTNKQLGAGAKFDVDHTGKSGAELRYEQEDYQLQVAQQYRVTDKKEVNIDSAINMQTKLIDAAASVRFEGEDKRAYKLEKGLDWLEEDLLISGYYLESNRGKELKRSFEIGKKKNGKLFSIDVEDKKNTTISFPTRLAVGATRQWQIEGDNSIGNKAVGLRYTLILDRDELFTYDIKTKRQSEYRKQSLEKKIKWDNSLGRLDFKVQKVEGAVSSDNEKNETSLWITVHRRF